MGSMIDEAIGGTFIDKINPLHPDNIGGEIGQTIADPLDLFGFRAEQTSEDINRILQESAKAGIELNEAQLAEIERLTAPFRETATEIALPQLTNLALGGEIDYQPSLLLQSQLERGRENILQSRAAGPGIKASGTFESLADLAAGLTAEDIGRFERGQVGLLEAGRGAEAGLLQSGTRLSGNIGALLSNLGAGQAATAQNLAQQQLASGQTAASGLQGLASLLES